MILAAVIATPRIAAEFEAGLEALACRDSDHAALRDIILSVAMSAPLSLAAEIEARLGPRPLENLHSLRHVAITPCLRDPGNVDLARMTVAEELAKLAAHRGLEAEVADAVEDMAEDNPFVGVGGIADKNWFAAKILTRRRNPDIDGVRL